MPKRLNKKLLLGLGSSLGFLGTGIVSGFGFNAIVNSLNETDLNNRVNRLSEQPIENWADYNVATRDMFIDTTNLRVHFGNTQKGQTVTPWGWLGVYEEPNNKANRLALTSWSGEILWVNNDYANQNNSTYNIYDLKYDWNSDFIFVLRSNSPNGFFNVSGNQISNNNNSVPEVRLDILDAKTGERVYQMLDKDFFNKPNSPNESVQLMARRALFRWFTNVSDAAKMQNLYYLDLASKENSNETLITFMPNFLQLSNQNSPVAELTLPSLWELVNSWKESAVSVVLQKNNIPGSNSAHFKRQFDIGLSRQIFVNTPEWFPNGIEGNNSFNSKEYFLLTNPFYTVSQDGGTYILHLILGDKAGTNIFHKVIGFKIGNSLFGALDDRYDWTELIGGTNFKGTDFRIDVQRNNWGNAHRWSTTFLKANLRVNKNIFDNNSVVFPYPWAASQFLSFQNMPIFNIAQIAINPSNGGIIRNTTSTSLKRSINYNFGEQIWNHWNTNKQPNSNDYSNNYTGNKILPWPGLVRNKYDNSNHNYNRLIGVSPFDNTILYAAKPNRNEAPYDSNDNQKDNYASFWLANSWDRQKFYRPLVISNQAYFGGTIASTMVSHIDDIYANGFSFDLQSLVRPPADNDGGSLNLYFNQTGSARNTNYSGNARNGFLTSKIGLVDDVLKRQGNNRGWTNSITNISTELNTQGLISTITDNSFSSLIYSRANLQSWFPRTWQNIEKAGNAYRANEQLNGSPTTDNRAVANRFGQPGLTGNLFNSKEAVDLYSDWTAERGIKPPNYERLIVKRPEIRVRSESIENQLPVETTYPFKAFHSNKNDWQPSAATRPRLTFKTQENLNHGAIQIFSSWSSQMRIDGIGNNTNNINIREIHNYNNSNPVWFDQRKQAINDPFGKINNDLFTLNNQRVNALRPLFQIVKPTGNNLPAWFNSLPSNLFDKYPLSKDKVGNETDFETILQRFLEAKTRAIDLWQNSANLAIGLTNLKIDAFADLNLKTLNPVSQQVIFKKGNKRIVNINNQGLKLIYEDQYRGNRTIYDQSALNYTDFNKQGFGPDVRNVLTNSYNNNKLPAANAKIKTTINYAQLPDTLVRQAAGNQNPVFTFEYKPNTRNRLVLRPTNATWFENHFANFNRLINLGVEFEYQTEGANPANWTKLGQLSDQTFKQNYQNQQLELPFNVPNNVNKLRFRLRALTDDVNNFVQMQGFNENENKFISDSHAIATQKIIVDRAWFNQERLTLGNPNQSLINISAQDINDFENRIFNHSPSLSGANNTLRSKVKLVYQFNNEPTQHDAQSLERLIKAKLQKWDATDQGVFALWNGKQGIKIRATFALTTTDNSVQLVGPNNQSLPTDQLTGDILSDVKTNVDLSAWFNELSAKKVTAHKGNQPGELTSFTIPGKDGQAGSGQFHGRDFATIERILRNVGVDTQYKKWDANNVKSDWLNAANQVNTYNPADPKIILGFKTNPDWNIRLIFNQNEFSATAELPLKLALPQLVTIKQEALNQFISAQPIKGNTFKININSVVNAENTLKQAIISANNTASQSNAFDGLQINIKYRLGENGNFESATNLQQNLANSNTTKINNSLWIKFELNHSPTDFELAADAAREHKVYDNGNNIIKKFIHGNPIETKLNDVLVDGQFGNLGFTYPAELQKILNENGADGFSNALKLQYTLGNLATSEDVSERPGGDPKTQWIDLGVNGIPGNLNVSDFPDPSVKKIYLQVVLRHNQTETFIYGPDDPNESIAKQRGEINLENISRKIAIDPNWFSQISLIENQSITIDQLNQNHFQNFEDRIWQRANIAPNDPDRAKLTLKYSFNGRNDLNLQNLLREIQNYQSAYDQPHLGILSLWNGTVADRIGTKIQASFATVNPNEPTIQFVDNATGAAATKLTGDINTQQIKTNVDLRNFVNQLVQGQTTVALIQNRPGTVANFEPPNMPNNQPNQFLNGKTYEQISQRLSDLGITIAFAQFQGNQKLWVPKANVNSYDVTTSLLPFSFENQSFNLNLQVQANQVVNPGDLSHNPAFNLRLNAPKQISILESDLTAFLQSQPFTGNTKNIVFNQAPVTQLIQAILARNAQINPDFASAPLEVVFQIADLPYMKGNDLVTFLENKSDADLINRQIKFKFQIQQGQTNQWLIDPANQEYFLYREDNNNPLQIFVHDQGLFAALGQTILGGTNEQLSWTFAQGIQVDPQQGTITWNNPIRARGLKIQYTFNSNANVSDANNANTIEQGWVDQQPNRFDPNQKNLFLRIQPVSSKYLYEKTADQSNAKISFDLQQIHSLIEVDANWLNQNLVGPNTNINVKQIDLSHFNAYEQLVQAQMNQSLSPENQAKIAIAYEFNNETLTKNQIVNKIKNYPVSDTDFGWLQLWNDFQGTEIKAKFVKADQAGNYELRYKDPTKTDQLLDTKRIKTVVNLQPLVNWLTTVLVEIEAGTNPNSINRLIFPAIQAQNSPFNGKTWDLSSTVLARLGIKIEYQKVDGQANNPWGPQNVINAYDGQGRFNVRFVLEQNKANNIIAQIKTGEQLENPHNANQNSQPISVNLKVTRQIIIKNEFVQAFINSENVILGNTKNLQISDQAEANLINQIKADNQASNPNAQPAFNSAPLTILYSIGQNPDTIPAVNWLAREAFINALAQNQNDQTSNQINFKFVVNTPANQEAAFSVNPTISQLNPHEQPANVSKIAYYINTNQWENNARNVQVRGTNSALRWQWNNLNVSEENGLNLITLNSGLKGLKIEFTAKPNALYSDPEGQANANIKTSWSTTRPTSIDPNTTGLFIRLKAQPGFVYQAQENISASVHSVDLQIKFQIEVDKNWISIPDLTSNDGYIDTLAVADLDRFSQTVLNNLQPDLRDKVELVFQFNEQGAWLNSANLINQIETYRRSYQSPANNYGLLQLFNGSFGLKIKAKFSIKNVPGNEKYELIAPNNSVAEADLSAIIKTASIKTLIDLKAWINLVQSIKIDFEPAANQPNSISKIKPPAFPGDLGSGPLAGLSFEQLEQLLAKHNLAIEWRAVRPNQGQNQGWGPKNQLTSYDPNNPTIQIRFKANSTRTANLVLSIAADKDFAANQNTPSSAITLTLKVAAQIKIDPQLVQAFINNPNRVGGNTKNLTLDQQAEANLIQQIKEQNEATSPNLGFANAPLIIEYKLGDAGDNWLKLNSFINSLEQADQDQKTNKILFRFNLENQDPNEPDFSVNPAAQILSEHQNPDEADLRIQYYIHSANWETSANNVSLSGFNNQLKWNYGSWIVHKDGAQSLVELPSGLRGLQIQYTAQMQPNYNDQNLGQDLYQQWVNQEPNTISPTTQQLAIRLVATTGFVYQAQAEQKATVHDISLANLKFAVPVALDWINTTLINLAQGQFVNQISKNDLDQWMQRVLANLDATLRDKITLEFSFNNQTNLTSQALYEAIQNYIENYANGPDFGLLQLWNQISGLKISATFKAVDPNGQYIPVVGNSSQPADLTATINTSNIKTLVILQPLINLLKNKQTKVSFVPGATENSIQSLNLPAFPGVLGQGPLTGLSFEQLESLLERHGVVFEWRSVSANNTENDWKPRNQLTSYDPGYGQIELRLNVKQAQPGAAQNLVFSLETSQDYQPANSKPSQAIKFNLQVAKKITLDPALINNFKTAADVVGGNTKFLKINADAENTLIEAILQANDAAKPDVVPPFSQARLFVLYSLGDLNRPNQLEWLKREAFLAKLAETETDQTTNQINFKFSVENADENAPDFIVEPTADILSEHKEPQATDLAIKYYINDAQWEQQATSVTVSGTNNNLRWNWNALQNQIREANNQVFVGRGLRLEFSGKENANYQDPAANDQPGANLKTEWISAKPSQIPVDLTNLWIRLKPLNGFVYGPAEKTTASAKAIALDQLVSQLIVDKTWIETTAFGAQINFVEQISLEQINQFSQAVIANYQPANLQTKIGLRFSFNNSAHNLDAAGLLQAIQSYMQATNNTTKGLLKLFDRTSNTGIKIGAQFISLDSKFELVDQNLQANPNNLKADVNTDNINTNINLQAYVAFLVQNPLRVRPGKNEGQLEEIFLPNFSNTTSPANFNGLTWQQASLVLDQLGVKLEAAAFLDPNFVPTETDWKDWNAIKQYNPEIGKIKFRFKIKQPSNIVLSVLNQHDVNFGNQKGNLSSNPFDVSLAVPLKIKVTPEQIQNFIQASQIRGNTKFLEIATQPENDFLENLIQTNSATNGLFAQARGRIKIKYALGQNPGVNTQWRERSAFIEFLKQQTNDQQTNQISFALFVENPDQAQQIFEIDLHTSTIIRHQINKNALVLLYVHERGLENLASQMAIRGTNNNFTYVNVPGLNLGPDSSINGLAGLKLQYSTKVNITNALYDSATAQTMDPRQGWTNRQVTQIDPQERFLAVQVVAIDGYVYGADYAKQHPDQDSSPHWQVHQVDVQQILSEIKLTNQGLNEIFFAATLPDLAIADVKALEIKAKNAANFEVAALKDKVKIEYQAEWQNQVLATWTTLEELQTKINQLMQNFSGDNLGLLKFNGAQSTTFATIKARFVADDPLYVVVEQTSANDGIQAAANGLAVRTEKLITPVDLRKYVQILQDQFINLPPGASSDDIGGFEPPAAPETTNDQFSNHSFAEISHALSLIGIQVEFLAPDSPTTNNNWVPINEIVALNNKNELFLRFRLDPSKIAANEIANWQTSFKISTKNLNDGWTWNQIVPNDQVVATAPIKLRVDLQILLTTDKAILATTFNNQFQGTTAQLNQVAINAISVQVNNLIQTTLNNNSTNGTDVSGAPLSIQFSLNRQILNPDNKQIWFEIADFAKILTTNKTNWNSNEIEARWYINPNQADAQGQRYQISDGQPIVVQAQNNQLDAPLKMFIHAQAIYADAQNIRQILQVRGNNQNYTINGLQAWSQLVPQGLELFFTNRANPDLNTDADWINYTQSQDLPRPLDADANLQLRFKVKPGYLYENATVTNPLYSEPVSLDTSQLQIVLSLNTQWLKAIQLDGNLKDLSIDETAARQAMINSGQLPTDQDQLIQFEYSINGQNWFAKTAFENHLQTLAGRKDETNFILKREELFVRFKLDNPNDKYQLEIDGTLIDPAAPIPSQFNVALINDRENRNTNVTGYINIAHLSFFTADNFAINGTTTGPILIIKNRDQLNNLLAVYASSNLFTLEFSTQFNPASQEWQWVDTQVIWKNGQLVSERELINQGIQIGPKGYFALRLRATNPKYDVYDANGQQQAHNQGYIIDVSPNVHITIEIENPFTKAQKTLRVWTRDNNNQARYEQGQGGFKIVVANKNDFEVVNPNQPQSAQEFLKQAQGLIQAEKDALEFVYHIFEEQPTTEQMQALSGLINNYDDPTWSSFSKIEAQNDWSQNLGLKVGQFVALALRVKEKPAQQGQIYVLKDNDQSLVLPIVSQNNQVKMPGRLAGYEIKANKIAINPNILLFNNRNNDLPLIDGFSALRALNLKVDPEDQYLGIELDLLLYNQFWLDANNTILKAPNGTKLVKRDPSTNVVQDQFYTKLDGSPITDANGSKIPILKDANGRPTAPLAQSQPTLKQRLQTFAAGQFGLPAGLSESQIEHLSFFRNQKIAVQLKPRIGLGSANEPDFYLDNESIIDLENLISPQIKFPIENENLITYEWIRDDFLPSNIQYNSTDPNRPDVAAEGQAEIASILKLSRKTANQNPQIITGKTPQEVLKALEQQLKTDFHNQLRFEVLYTSVDGGEQVYPDANIYRFQNLKNGDKITLNIVAADSDLVYLEQPQPLTINIRGLAVPAPNQERLRFLRVEQNGTVNGEGSFRVLISDPAGPDQAIETLLAGWKFVIRVWNSNQQIKIDWTADQSKITKLVNGDKVEWKLVSNTGNPVKDPYYNTVAQKHTLLPDGSTQFNFAKVNYPAGQNSEAVVAAGIGQNPKDDQVYPTDSGFVISGLDEVVPIFDLANDAFAKILAQLEPRYVGFNGQGSINFNEQYLNGDYYINANGELYKKDLTSIQYQLSSKIPEISLSDFLDQTTFYTSDPNLIAFQNGFKFIGNDTNLNNHLSNGDRIWAQFDLQIDNNEVNRGISTELNPVSGLQELVTDPMTPLWYILMAIGGALTLGGLSLFMLWAKRNKKLKK